MSLQKALQYFQSSSISMDEWARRVQKGYNGKPFKYKNTNIWKGLKEIERAKKQPPLPPVPPSQPAMDLSDVQRCLFLTGDISRALETKNRLLIATADLGYRQNYTTSFIQQSIAQNRFRVWCDCRPSPLGTPPRVALDWLSDLGLPPSFFYGQCESQYEFDWGYNAGARKFVGNISALTGTLNDPQSQLGRVESGEVHVTNETYYNKDRNLQPDWRNADGVGSNCMAVYESKDEGAEYYSLALQQAQGKYNPAVDCVYVAGFRDADWTYVISH